MKAMILAAGLGIRLRPLTDKMPKALIKVEGKTLLERALLHLKANGISQVIINVHHLAPQIIKYLDINKNFGMKIAISDESDDLLDTGGGLDFASWFFDSQEPFVIRNVDVLSDLNLVKMLAFHRDGRALATLAVRNRETSRYFLFGKENNLLCGWENEKTGEKIIVRKEEQAPVKLAFSGIHVLVNFP
jgi:NDP-sugar pyrophosphorylase family protein